MAIQSGLRMQGEFQGKVDGQFGPVTKRGVLRLQHDPGISVDGVVGQQTWRAMITQGNGECEYYCGPGNS